MMEYLNIGSTPADEFCLGVGHLLAKQECRVYAKQLAREFPQGIFQVRGFGHDFGTYYEVCAYYIPGEDSEAAAFEAEGNASPVWDAEAKLEVAKLYLEAA